jgi:hypothetical protein
MRKSSIMGKSHLLYQLAQPNGLYAIAFYLGIRS